LDLLQEHHEHMVLRVPLRVLLGHVISSPRLVVQVRLSRRLRPRPALRSFLPTSPPVSLTASFAALTGWASFFGISSCTDVVNIFRASSSSGMPTGSRTTGTQHSPPTSPPTAATIHNSAPATPRNRRPGPPSAFPAEPSTPLLLPVRRVGTPGGCGVLVRNVSRRTSPDPTGRGAELVVDRGGVVVDDLLEHLLGPLRVPVHGQVLQGYDACQPLVAVDAGHRGRPHESTHGTHALTEGEEVGDGVVELPVADRVDDRPRRDDLVADRRDHLALPAYAVDVADAGGVPRPGVGERGLAVDLLAALLHVQ